MEWLSDKCIEIINDLHTERLDYTSEYLPLINAAQKLSAYEDTMSLERAKELAQAEKDGRLVVLPCEVGDTVYVTYGEGYITCVVDRMHIIANNQVQVRMRNFIIETLWLSVSEFGETVFLTRDEAEEALKKREEEDGGKRKK